jgi:hypothetical protein
MWIRPTRTLQARMPSMRPAPSTPSAPAATKPKRGPDKPAAAPPPEAEVPPSSDEEARARGGFHESSYELRTGMDMLEGDWPDDTTLPGELDDR